MNDDVAVPPACWGHSRGTWVYSRGAGPVWPPPGAATGPNYDYARRNTLCFCAECDGD